ncbi:MAG: hypothetical protein QM485_11330 [Flavobacteriaceae bacterium]
MILSTPNYASLAVSWQADKKVLAFKRIRGMNSNGFRRTQAFYRPQCIERKVEMAALCIRSYGNYIKKMVVLGKR